jgi:hypothetical protein
MVQLIHFRRLERPGAAMRVMDAVNRCRAFFHPVEQLSWKVNVEGRFLVITGSLPSAIEESEAT